MLYNMQQESNANGSVAHSDIAMMLNSWHEQGHLGEVGLAKGLIELLRNEFKHYKESNIDRLTGAKNRKKFDEDSRRYTEEMSYIFIDLDNFKKVNDEYGHQIGDRTLQDAVSDLKRVARGSDIYRFGGEELVIILPNTDVSGAKIVAERCRRYLETKTRDYLDNKPFTASFGVASLTQVGSVEELLKKADDCLYKAKRDGKNRVVSYDPTVP